MGAPVVKVKPKKSTTQVAIAGGAGGAVAGIAIGALAGVSIASYVDDDREGAGWVAGGAGMAAGALVGAIASALAYNSGLEAGKES